MVARPTTDLAAAPARTTTLGELVSALFEAFLEEYGDEELAALATSTWLTERFAESALGDENREAA
jgi:hypothetical protein